MKDESGRGDAAMIRRGDFGPSTINHQPISADCNCMDKDEQILEWNTEGLLADVVGFETDEVARSARGAEVVTYRAKRFIDFTAGIAVHNAGHSHPDVVEAIREQAARVVHVSDTMRHAPQLALGHWMRGLFARVAPGPPWTFLYLNSGSESIEAAAKLAVKATGRSDFIAFQGAFHGRTMLATALSRSKRVHWEAYEPFLQTMRAHIHHAPAPRGTEFLPELEKLLERVGSRTAALFLEPQQGEGGYHPVTPEAARRIRELTERYGILLVCDEIQTGWGRTGRWLGFQHLEIVPDIVVFGKAVGGGLPLAGLAVREDLMARWEPGEHGTTFGGNPLACAAGLAALQVMEREHLVDRSAKLGEQVRARLSPLVGHFGVSDVRGLGLMIGIELRDAAGRPDYARCEAVKRSAREEGLLILTCGAKIGDPAVDNATIRLIPPLNIPEPTLEKGLDILEESLRCVPVSPAP